MVHQRDLQNIGRVHDHVRSTAKADWMSPIARRLVGLSENFEDICDMQQSFFGLWAVQWSEVISSQRRSIEESLVDYARGWTWVIQVVFWFNSFIPAIFF